jgi:hypothetical protein
MPEPTKFRRRSDDQAGSTDQKSWAQWKQELFEAIEELDAACAKARQVIYALRPLVRPKGERGQ